MSDVQKPIRVSIHARRRYFERFECTATDEEIIRACIGNAAAVWVERPDCVLLVTVLSNQTHRHD